jgi:gluconokinase
MAGTGQKGEGVSLSKIGERLAFVAMNVPNLRSPSEKTGGIYYFGRMIDKIRLHAANLLPAEYVGNLGSGFDGRALSFLWIEYPSLVDRVKQGGTDEEILEWAFTQGRRPNSEEIEVWNEFMRKRGWNDEASERIEQRKAESGFASRTDIQTFFDYIDLDEGRDPRANP